MLLCAHNLTLSLLAVTTFISVLSACARQRTPVSAAEPVTASLPIQTSVPAMSDASSTPALLVLIDSASMHIDRIIPTSDGIPFGLAFARQRLWVLRRGTSFLPPGSILEIDPVSGQIVRNPIQVDFDPFPVPFPPYAEAASATDAWFGVAGITDDADPTDDRIVRIDLRTNTNVDTIRVGDHTIAMVFADGSLLKNLDERFEHGNKGDTKTKRWVKRFYGSFGIL